MFKDRYRIKRGDWVDVDRGFNRRLWNAVVDRNLSTSVALPMATAKQHLRVVGNSGVDGFVWLKSRHGHWAGIAHVMSLKEVWRV